MNLFSRENSIAQVISWVGIITWIISFILGLYLGNSFYYGYDWSVTFSWWASGFVSGILIIGFSEVIELLHKIYHGQRNTSEDKVVVQNSFVRMEKVGLSEENLLKFFQKNNPSWPIDQNVIQKIVDLYDMQGKIIEEVTITPFEKHLIVKTKKKGDTISYYEIVKTYGNDPINFPIEKELEIKNWFEKNNN